MWRASRNTFILTLVISLASAEEGDSLTSIEQALNDEFPIPVNPLQTDIAIGDYLCPILTETLEPDPNPDLSELTVQYRTPEGEIVILNLANAAQVISEPYSHYYDNNKILMTFVSGLGSSPFDGVFVDICTALDATGQYNFLGMDTTSVILVRDYIGIPVTAAKHIGDALGEALVSFYELLGQPWEKILLICLSLGGHVCGVAGKMVHNKTGYLIERINALDPGGPCYMNLPPYMKLNRSDAKFVNTIHTNAGVIGLNDNIGHADFRPNGGTFQSGCFFSSGCSHLRVIALYLESIYKMNAFLAVACHSHKDFREDKCSSERVPMGHYCPNTARGVFYLQTAATSPYGLGEEGTHYDPIRAGLIQNIQNEVVDPDFILI